MDFSLSEEQFRFQESVIGFAERHLAKDALARAHDETYPHDVAKLASEQGLFGIAMPERDGGQGGTILDSIIACQAIASVCPRSADVMQVGNFGAIRVLAEFGNDDQKERYLRPILAGDKLICVSMSEPEAGSAVTDLVTTATPDGSGFRLNGSKVFATHGPYADIMLVYVRFGEGIGGIGSVLIEKGTEGVNIGKPSYFMNDDIWAEVHFDNVYVPAENVLLGEGGFKRQISGFNVERLGNSSRALALGRYAFDYARDYALDRKQFGRPIAEFQGLQWKFADAHMKIEAAQLMLYKAAVTLDDKGLPHAHDTALAKAWCNLAGFEAANEAVQVMGALGYSRETLVEYCFRRCRGWMIAGGSIEILKNRIAEGVFGRRFSQRPG